MRLTPRFVALVVILGAVPVASGGPAGPVEVVLTAPLPDAIARPEGRSRWDLSAVWTRPATWAPIAVVDPYGGDDARRWTAPQEFRDELRPGVRRTLEMDETRAGRAASRLRVDTEIVGIGWLHLPSGPREVVLQRALV